MLSDSNVDARLGIRAATQACDLPSTMPPRLACGMNCARSAARPDMRGDVRPDCQPTVQGIFCEHGLSVLQINVLALILRAGARVTPYGRITRQLAKEFDLLQTAESVRGVVNRLVKRGFIRRKQAREGTIRGVRFSPVDALICPHITPVRADTRCGVRGEARPGPYAAPSILKETDRKNTLSISSEEAKRLEAICKLEALAEDDIAFHWPELARVGFGTIQIRQILQRLAQVNIGPEQISQGLIYAEWELAAGKMHDKSGKPVSSPLDWVFKSLATHGYYRKPKEYVSPQEQAIRDETEERNQLAAARKALFEAEYAAWESGLSEAERQSILELRKKNYPMPPRIILDEHFRSTVWPSNQNSSIQKMPDTEEGNSHEQ